MSWITQMVVQIRLWLTPARPVQTLRCYCPECRAELCAQESAFQGYCDLGLVQFRCERCGKASQWNFDCPTPYTVNSLPRPLGASVHV